MNSEPTPEALNAAAMARRVARRAKLLSMAKGEIETWRVMLCVVVIAVLGIGLHWKVLSFEAFIVVCVAGFASWVVSRLNAIAELLEENEEKDRG